MGKDKAIGAIIMVAAVLIIVIYTLIGPIDLYIEHIGGDAPWGGLLSWRWAVVIPMWLVVFLVGVIAAWIGFSMLTTPPPVPLEELEEELEAEEAGSD